MCITSIRKFALLIISVQGLITHPSESIIDWSKLKSLRLNTIVETPKAVNQIPITDQIAKKKSSKHELLKEADWKIKRPKQP